MILLITLIDDRVDRIQINIGAIIDAIKLSTEYIINYEKDKYRSIK